jgi:Phosphate-selective porin O and P
VTLRTTRLAWGALGAIAALLAASPAAAQATIKVNDDVNLRFGVLGQVQADTLEDPGTDATTNNLFIRRVRLLFGGQVAKNVTFFVETDSANLGRSVAGVKNIPSTTIIQDAYGEFKARDEFAIDAGLMFVPFSRNSVQSAATLLPIDYGAYTFTQSAPTQSSTGRDTGIQAKGYFAKNHFEYRLGAFQGARDARSHRAFRVAGRAMYNFLDTEVGFFYTGTNVGKRKVAAVAGAFDTQSDYHAYDGDVFIDYPAGPGAVTLQFDYTRFDGGTTLTAIPKQNDLLLELGYLITAVKVTPVLQIATRDILDTTKGDEKRYSLGANYWWAAHNANVKLAFMRIDPTGAAVQKEFTIQLQFFYY